MDAVDFLAWRRLLNMTQQQAAEKLGMSLRQISSYETGAAAVPTPVELATKYLTLKGAEKSRFAPQFDGRHKMTEDRVALAAGKVRIQARDTDGNRLVGGDAHEPSIWAADDAEARATLQARFPDRQILTIERKLVGPAGQQADIFDALLTPEV